MLGYIYDEDGNLCGTVTGHFVDVATMNVSDEYSLTYAYDLYSTTNHELLAYGPDSGYASTVYLTIKFNTDSAGKCLLTGVSGYWVISDPLASVASASLHYACTEYSQPYSQDATRSVTNIFNYSTGFSTYVHANSAISSVTAELKLNYKIGTSGTWSFTLQNTYI